MTKDQVQECSEKDIKDHAAYLIEWLQDYQERISRCIESLRLVKEPGNMSVGRL